MSAVARTEWAYTPDSFAQLLRCWPSVAALADDLGLEYKVVHGWHRRNSVPRWHFAGLLDSALRFGIPDISLARLEALDRRRHPPRRRAVLQRPLRKQGE